MNEKEKMTSFQTMKPHFDALARIGYFKIVLKPLTPLKRALHRMYRGIIWLFVILYNFQHLVRVIQCRHSTSLMVDTLFILLTTLNTLGKQIAFNGRSRRIDALINIVNGPKFALSDPYHEEVMRSNGLVMSRLLKLYHCAVLTCALLWTLFPLVNKILGEDDQFTAYIPFDTTSKLTFGIAHAYMSILITVQGYGNVTMDCTIVAFFSQARTQIQIFRYNMENFVRKNRVSLEKSKIKALSIFKENEVRYIDHGEDGINLQKRLIKCVKHHKQIVWFSKEVESIFGEALVVQFLVMAWVICMTVYKIVGLSILSAEFVSMACYLLCMMAQLFIYCYFGTQLRIESEFINDSLYRSDWLALSPRFRKQLLIMMQGCHKPIAPRTAYIVPMSLETYIKVLKSSYTLFTFLNRK